MVLDSVRTLVIWLFSLSMRWQNFNYLQVVGFLLLIVGMCLYNNVIIAPALQRLGILPSRRLNSDPPDALFAPAPPPVIVSSPQE